MRVDDFPAELTPLQGAMPVWCATVDAAMWRHAAEDVREKGGRLVALWGAPRCCAHDPSIRSGLVWLKLPLMPQQLLYPDIGDILPRRQPHAAGPAFDLVGVRADSRDQRRWLRHGAWPGDQFPLRESFDGTHHWPNSG
jgi:hypothetical protein